MTRSSKSFIAMWNRFRMFCDDEITWRSISIDISLVILFSVGNSTLQVRKWRKTNVDPYEKHWIWNSAQKLPNQYRRLSKSSRESFARITQFSSKMSVSFLNVSRTFRKRDTFLLKNTARFKMTTMKKNSLEKLSENLERRERKREEKEKGIKGELPPPSISANKPFGCTLSPPGDQQCSQRERAKLKPANEAERPSIIEEYRAAR